MRIIALISYFFWGILGLFFWIPLLVRVIASFCGSLAYNMIVNDPNNIQNSKHSLELAIGFYSKGFESIHSTIYGTHQGQASNTAQEFHLMSFLFQVIWTIIFWGTLILPFTKLDFSFRKEYIFKEPFDNNSHNWLVRDTDSDKFNINNGKLIMNCKENPNDKNYGYSSNFCNFSMSDCPTKYTIEINTEFINGDFSSPFGIIIANKDGKNDIRFNVFNDIYASVYRVSTSSVGTVSLDMLCDSVKIDSDSRLYKLKIEVKGGDFIYYANDTQVLKSNFNISPMKFRPYVMRNQIVEYDDINIVKN
jgi:hypothetical protein